MSIRLCEGNHLIDVCLMRYEREVPILKSQLPMVSNFLGAVSEKPNIVSCGRVTAYVLNTLEKMQDAFWQNWSSLPVHYL